MEPRECYQLQTKHSRSMESAAPMVLVPPPPPRVQWRRKREQEGAFQAANQTQTQQIVSKHRPPTVLASLTTIQWKGKKKLCSKLQIKDSRSLAKTVPWVIPSPFIQMKGKKLRSNEVHSKLQTSTQASLPGAAHSSSFQASLGKPLKTCCCIGEFCSCHKSSWILVQVVGKRLEDIYLASQRMSVDKGIQQTGSSSLDTPAV